MLQGRDVICISSIDWDFNWQGPQEIMSRLAEGGNRVLFIENTGIRAPRLQDAARVEQRLRHWLRSSRTHGLRQIGPTLYVHSPLVLPPFGPGPGRKINSKLLMLQVARAMNHLGMKDVIIFSYLPTDTAVDLVQTLRTSRSVIVYYRVDNLALLTPHAEQLRESERALIEESDLIFANSLALADLPAKMHKQVHVFPPSVNLEAFPLEKPAHLKQSHLAASCIPLSSRGPNPLAGDGRPNDSSRPGLKELRCPVIGYIGAAQEHINWDLLTTMARQRPSWSWAFVGPLRPSREEILNLPNVRFFGQQLHSDLIKFIRGFDVCIIPYRLSAYTATVVPTKLNEYLAVGKPVVSTNLPAVCNFNEQHEVVITSREEPEGFLRAIEEALRSPRDEVVIERRREVAAISDWRKRIQDMSGLLESALTAKDQGRA